MARINSKASFVKLFDVNRQASRLSTMLSRIRPKRHDRGEAGQNPMVANTLSFPSGGLMRDPRTSSSLSHLPNDLLEAIADLLPVKDFLALSATSTDLNRITSNRYSIQMQLQKIKSDLVDGDCLDVVKATQINEIVEGINQWLDKGRVAMVVEGGYRFEKRFEDFETRSDREGALADMNSEVQVALGEASGSNKIASLLHFALTYVKFGLPERANELVVEAEKSFATMGDIEEKSQFESIYLSKVVRALIALGDIPRAETILSRLTNDLELPLSQNNFLFYHESVGDIARLHGQLGRTKMAEKILLTLLENSIPPDEGAQLTTREDALFLTLYAFNQVSQTAIELNNEAVIKSVLDKLPTSIATAARTDA